MGKYKFDAEKRKRKEKEQVLIKTQKRAMDKFTIKQTQVSTDNQSVDPSILALDIVAYNDLATITLGSELLEKIGYEDVIDDFILKNTKRMMFK